MPTIPPTEPRSRKDEPDPSENVQALMEASLKALAELRVSDKELNDAKHSHTNEIVALRANYDEKLREAEAKRIDAIRAVDVAAVSTASARAADQASVLAAQVTTSADALRGLVATSASTLAAQSAAAIAEIMKRLAELERTKYEVAGRSTVADPQIAEMLGEIKALRQSQTLGTGKSQGVSALWGIILGGVGLLAAVLAIAARFGGTP